MQVTACGNKLGQAVGEQGEPLAGGRLPTAELAAAVLEIGRTGGTPPWMSAGRELESF